MVVILDENKKLLLLKRPNYPKMWAPGKWSFHGGKVEPGESGETMEETQLTVGGLVHVPRWSNKEVNFFVAQSYSGEIEIDYEHEDWMWIDRAHVENYDLAPNVLNLYDWALSHD